jgi:phage terminase small subunit
MSLSEQQERFCQLIAQGKNASDAYRDAGYKCTTDEAVWSSASRLLGNAKVALRIKALQDEAAKHAALTAAGFAKRLNRIAMAAERTALKAEQTDAGEIEMLAAKDAADVARQSIMDAAKLLGLIIDQSKVQSENVNYNIGDTPLSPEEWEREFAADKDAVGAPARTPARPH